MVHVKAHTRHYPKKKKKKSGKAQVSAPKAKKKSRAPVKSTFAAERKITGDKTYGMPLYGKGVSVLEGARRQFAKSGQ